MYQQDISDKQRVDFKEDRPKKVKRSSYGKLKGLQTKSGSRNPFQS